MLFNVHKNLWNTHAIFSPSQSAWLRYDDEKIMEAYVNRKAAEMGTRLHAWAAETIKLGLKQARSKKTLYSYVNDAIGFKMEPEVVLFYSERFFGTADTICFRDNMLRIHDLKTGKVGKIETHLEQLEIYAALFCLEYRFRPSDIDMELRVYKYDEVVCHVPEPERIQYIMDRIVYMDKLLDKLENERG